MSDGQQEESAASTIEYHVMEVLNPRLYHHDLLQSYVRTEVSDSKQDESEDAARETRSSDYSIANNGNNDDGRDQRKKRDNKSEKDRFDAIESEMKIQKSRRKWRQHDCDSHRQEEVYTDKDRAAAVNTGTTDIKQSLKIKQRQDRSKDLQIPEETEPGALLTLGLREMRFGDVNVAINCINKVHLHFL